MGDEVGVQLSTPTPYDIYKSEQCSGAVKVRNPKGIVPLL